MQSAALISDIHGNILALEAVVADIRRRRIETVLNLGDHLSGPLWPKETAAFLMKQHDWVQISGNHDRVTISMDPAALGPSDAYVYRTLDKSQKSWLGGLPASALLFDEILAFHGTPSDDSEYLLESVERGRGRLASLNEIEQRLSNRSAPVMACGHTHIQRAVQTNRGILIVNPGSVGLPAFDDDLPEPHIMESGSPHARYAILEKGEGGWTAALVSVPYASLLAAQRARNNDRPEWAVALETGFMER
jgi:predicted phosphodiesterase